MFFYLITSVTKEASKRLDGRKIQFYFAPFCCSCGDISNILLSMMIKTDDLVLLKRYYEHRAANFSFL